MLRIILMSFGITSKTDARGNYMKFVIDISEYDKEWIGNTYGIPQDINTKIAEAIINAEPCQPEPQYKTNYGFMWLCPKCGLPIHSDYTKCVRCGHNREKGV